MDVMYVCGVPEDAMEVVHEERMPERWCFGERKRRAGTLTCRRPRYDWLEKTEAWGWADPVWSYRCDGCGRDRRLGFGRVWEYDE